VTRIDGATAIVAASDGESVSVPDASGAGVAAGQQMHLTVRPEKIVIGTQQPSPGRCAIRGTVTEVVYLGTSTHYTVSTRYGPDLSVYVQNSSDADDVAARGDAVWLSWRPEHSLALADSTAEVSDS
jgi:spermidine/putrescine transport system ATP-binding protein